MLLYDFINTVRYIIICIWMVYEYFLKLLNRMIGLKELLRVNNLIVHYNSLFYMNKLFRL